MPSDMKYPPVFIYSIHTLSYLTAQKLELFMNRYSSDIIAINEAADLLEYPRGAN